MTTVATSPKSLPTRSSKQYVKLLLPLILAALFSFAYFTPHFKESILSLYTKGCKQPRLTTYPQSTNNAHETNPPSPQQPKVAWLMSFPNSGTSYTIALIRTISNTTTATNYCRKECHLKDDDDGSSGNHLIPVSNHSPQGPFLAHPSWNIPKQYILTKTHCSGYATGKDPSRYIETTRSFLMGCARGSLLDGKKVVYDPFVVPQKAVHLIRNPFDNVVSRFHLKQHRHVDVNDTVWLEEFGDSPGGFQRWCSDMDEKYRREDGTSRFLDEELLRVMRRVPCHSEFYQYGQWHRLALDATRNELEIPTLVVHYEDYEGNFEETVDRLVDFLEVERVEDAPEFMRGKSYEHYFTKEQRVEVIKLLKLIVNEEVWSFLERYNVSET